MCNVYHLQYIMFYYTYFSRRKIIKINSYRFRERVIFLFSYSNIVCKLESYTYGLVCLTSDHIHVCLHRFFPVFIITVPCEENIFVSVCDCIAPIRVSGPSSPYPPALVLDSFYHHNQFHPDNKQHVLNTSWL